MMFSQRSRWQQAAQLKYGREARRAAEDHIALSGVISSIRDRTSCSEDEVIDAVTVDIPRTADRARASLVVASIDALEHKPRQLALIEKRIAISGNVLRFVFS